MRFAKNLYHLTAAQLANTYFQFPAKKITCIGVTGTDGKTTTTSLIYHILTSAGEKTAMISTVGAYINNKMYDIGFHVTTPSSFSLQKYIKKAIDEKNKYIVLEVTSHALDQNRVWGIPFQIGVITNITHEHLDYHKSIRNYTRTKMKLLQASKVTILNKDDRSYLSLIQELENVGYTNKILSYSLHDRNAQYTLDTFPFKSKLIGEFNKQNVLAAIAVACELGIPKNEIRKAIASYVPPKGRQEIVYDKQFKVIIDFAHTPNAFEKILPEIKPHKGKLIHVFGAAGQRDITKRPLMGKISSYSSDIIILTAEDPRKESIEKINLEIEKGIQNVFRKVTLEEMIRNPRKNTYISIPGRKKAIETSIAIAQKFDTVILTGKSHEKSMNYGNGEEPWDEFKIVKQVIKARK